MERKYSIRRVALLAIFFAALIEFAIERARFDLWIMAAVLVIPLANAVGRALGTLEQL